MQIKRHAFFLCLLGAGLGFAAFARPPENFKNDPALKAVRESIASDPDAKKSVRWIEPVPIVLQPQPRESGGRGISAAPSFDTLWGWKRMRGFNARYTGKGIRVAIVDTGVDLNHPALKGRIVETYNAVHPGQPVTDRNGHGTHVAGIIAARKSNDCIGIAPDVDLLIIKSLDDNGFGNNETLADGILWAVENEADIINLSLSSEIPPLGVKNAIEYAVKTAKKIVVCIAGNTKSDKPRFPGNMPGVITVSACTASGTLADFSNYGQGISFIAPGERIGSTWINSGYRELSGTSMAAPFVTGALALALEAGETRRKDKALAILKNACVSLKLDPAKEGAGLILVDKIKPLAQADPSTLGKPAPAPAEIRQNRERTIFTPPLAGNTDN